jgi:hypothetical protein
VDSGDEVQEIHGIDVESLAQIRGRIDARRLDVALDLLGHRGQPVHVQNLPADFLLVFRDVDVRIDLLGPEVVHDLHGPLSEDVTLGDVGERRLAVHGEHEYLLALAREPVRRRCGKGVLTNSAPAADWRVKLLIHLKLRGAGCHVISNDR